MNCGTLDRQTVAVVGGTAGMGSAVAALAKQEGAKVFVGSKSPDNVSATINELGVDGGVIDTMDEHSVEQFFQKTGEVDHLVVSAALVRPWNLRESPLSEGWATMQSKFFGPLMCVRHARVREKGSITLFSGILSRRPMRNDSILSPVNAAVEALGRALAIDLAPIRVNTVCPGMTRDTRAFSAMSQDLKEQMFDHFARRLPVGRVGVPGDIAKVVLMLMTNGFMTGTTIDVEGGHSLLSGFDVLE